MSRRIATIALLAVLLLTACSVEVSQSGNATADADRAPRPVAEGEGVQGQIRGSDVAMLTAELDDQLAIYEEEGWGFSPSLLIFFFLGEGESLAGRTFEVASGGGWESGNPHIHFRWREPESGRIESSIAMQDYDLELTFGAQEDDVIPGRITFSIPGEATSVEGSFRAHLK